jgi:hypothetical protein
MTPNRRGWAELATWPCNAHSVDEALLQRIASKIVHHSCDGDLPVLTDFRVTLIIQKSVLSSASEFLYPVGKRCSVRRQPMLPCIWAVKDLRRPEPVQKLHIQSALMLCKERREGGLLVTRK